MGVNRTVAVVAGGHHGCPPSNSQLKAVAAYKDNVGLQSDAWNSVRKDLLNYCVGISGVSMDSLNGVKLRDTTQVLLTGIVILADWIASNEVFFPLSHRYDYSDEVLLERAERGWHMLNLPKVWTSCGGNPSTYESRFGFSPRPFQSMARQVALKMSEPGIIVVEAPMGEGKTEAALMMSEILADRFGYNGLYFALPTQTTADRIFVRMKKWLDTFSDGTRTINLAHGKSKYNKEYREVPKMSWESSEDRVVIHEWLCGLKRSLLSDFVVGTVDNVLMCGLKRKHLVLTHLGLAEKVVIVDECHAYDSYMGSYLQKALEWLGAYHVPVVLLSATLPSKRRRELVAAYLKGQRIRLKPEESNAVEYPLITYADGEKTHQVSCTHSQRSMTVSIKKISEEEFMSVLDKVSSGGGYVAVLLNTVKRAQ